MSKIRTGDVPMDLFSKDSLKVKPSLAQNQICISGQTQVYSAAQKHQEMPKDW